MLTSPEKNRGHPQCCLICRRLKTTLSHNAHLTLLHEAFLHLQCKALIHRKSRKAIEKSFAQVFHRNRFMNLLNIIQRKLLIYFSIKNH